MIDFLKHKKQELFKNSDYREILSKGSWYLFLRGIGIISSYIFTYLITISYDASTLGVFSIGISIFMIISVVGRLGLDISLVKFFSVEANRQNTGIFYTGMFKAFLLSSLLAYVIYLLRYQIALELFEVPKPSLIPHLDWILPSIPFWTVTLICAGVSRAHKKIKWFTFISFTSRFFSGALILLVLLGSIDDSIIISQAHLYSVVLTSIISIIVAVKTLQNPKVVSNVESWKFIKQSLPIMVSSSVLILLGWIDTFILGIFESDANVGIYNVSLKIATLTSFTLLAINSILAPKIAKNYELNKKREYKTLIRFSAKLNFFVSTGIVFLVLVFNDFLFGIFGDEYVEGRTILFILCLGQLVNALAGSVGIILQMIGKQIIHQNNVLMALVLNIITTLILTPIYGGAGAAIATVASLIFWNIIGAIYLRRKMGITSYYNPFSKQNNDA
jgi:O-antigen/teichoic acid export membrane protein